MMYRVFTAALLAASSVSALTISSTCQAALTGVATNSDANACLSASSLLSVVLQSNASIITPVDNWLKSLCSAAPCSNATLSAVVTNITTGCSAELSSSPDSSASTLIPLVEQYYTTARKIVCLADSGTNCITQTLTNIQSILGTLSISNIGDVITKAATTTSLPTNITCTDCLKQAYNVLNTDFPSTASSLTSELDSECGASFTDGTTPADIKSTTSDNGKNSAMTLTRGTFVGSVLVVASSLWAFLA
ncbi:hypothetical protein MVEN_00523000 [Mycena venus]|uniref:Uncharacterized protein n=1 Tax=Mycena venus TaxID=2733690 RepID=A0A8H6YID6_9AGAR|nr:hypothetical protein MVEN_00523000 [Mycena venus]